MFLKIAILCAVGTFTQAENDDKKWVWGDNSRNGKSSLTSPVSLDNKAARYDVYEEEDLPYRPSFVPNQRPNQLNGNRPLYGYRPENNRPFRPDFGSEERPGGVYGSGPVGGYGQGPNSEGILTGPIPSWVKDGPYKEYDKCKCTEKFNCNSPGISYGHCDVGKQYCCYATKKLGGPPPSRPIHSAENGILVGPGGPVDGLGPNRFPRPGNFQRPVNGFGLGGRPQNLGPIYSPENGILVGPGGPIDRPYNRPGYGGYGVGRSAKKIE